VLIADLDVTVHCMCEGVDRLPSSKPSALDQFQQHDIFSPKVYCAPHQLSSFVNAEVFQISFRLMFFTFVAEYISKKFNAFFPEMNMSFIMALR